MNTLDILFLSIALAMDCFAVSTVSGVIMQRIVLRLIIRMSLLFGLFQAAMPLIGWLGINEFSDYFMNIDHWIAFFLLCFIGIKMIKDTFSKEEERHFNPSRLRTQILLAIATSIDALAIGISFACLGYNNIKSLFFPLAAIGITSFLAGIIGNLLGVICGKSIAKKLKPELIGGVILVSIGIKILISHLSEH